MLPTMAEEQTSQLEASCEQSEKTSFLASIQQTLLQGNFFEFQATLQKKLEDPSLQERELFLKLYQNTKMDPAAIWIALICGLLVIVILSLTLFH